MSKKDKHKPKRRKIRDWGVIMMLKHTKPGAMKNRKKEADKKKCRGKVKDGNS